MCEKSRILLVEDDPDQLAMMQKWLERNLDVVADTCMTAAGAEAKLNRSVFCLLILDIGLPDYTDGVEIARRVLQHDPGQPIILLSEYAGVGAIERDAAAIGLTITPKFSAADPKDFLNIVSEKLHARPCLECKLATGQALVKPLKLIPSNVRQARSNAQAREARAASVAIGFALLIPSFLRH